MLSLAAKTGRRGDKPTMLCPHIHTIVFPVYNLLPVWSLSQHCKSRKLHVIVALLKNQNGCNILTSIALGHNKMHSEINRIYQAVEVLCGASSESLTEVIENVQHTDKFQALRSLITSFQPKSSFSKQLLSGEQTLPGRATNSVASTEATTSDTRQYYTAHNQCIRDWQTLPPPDASRELAASSRAFVYEDRNRVLKRNPSNIYHEVLSSHPDSCKDSCSSANTPNTNQSKAKGQKSAVEIKKFILILRKNFESVQSYTDRDARSAVGQNPCKGDPRLVDIRREEPPTDGERFRKILAQNALAKEYLEYEAVVHRIKILCSSYRQLQSRKGHLEGWLKSRRFTANEPVKVAVRSGLKQLFLALKIEKQITDEPLIEASAVNPYPRSAIPLILGWSSKHLNTIRYDEVPQVLECLAGDSLLGPVVKFCRGKEDWYEDAQKIYTGTCLRPFSTYCSPLLAEFSGFMQSLRHSDSSAHKRRRSEPEAVQMCPPLSPPSTSHAPLQENSLALGICAPLNLLEASSTSTVATSNNLPQTDASHCTEPTETDIQHQHDGFMAYSQPFGLEGPFHCAATSFDTRQEGTNLQFSAGIMNDLEMATPYDLANTTLILHQQANPCPQTFGS